MIDDDDELWEPMLMACGYGNAGGGGGYGIVADKGCNNDGVL